MNILVIGHQGYIGSVLMTQLSNLSYEEAYTVYGIDSEFYSHPIHFSSTKKDMRSITKDDLKNIDVCIHFGELSNNKVTKFNIDASKDICNGSIQLAKNCKETETRLIYMSSCSVYGSSDEIKTEESECKPATQYAKNKLMVEHAICELESNLFKPVILRLSTVYGPSQSMRFDSVINQILTSAYINRKIILNNKGLAWRPLVYIDSVTNAILQIIKCEQVPLIINVGDINIQIKNIVPYIKKLMSRTKTEEKPITEDYISYRIDFSKFQKFKKDYDQKLSRGLFHLMDFYYDIIHLNKNKLYQISHDRYRTIQKLKRTNQLNELLYWR